MKMFKVAATFVDCVNRVSTNSDLWRLAGDDDAWRNTTGYLEAHGVVDARQRQVASARNLVYSPSTCVVTITQ